MLQSRQAVTVSGAALIYRLLFELVLRRIPAETAHSIAARSAAVLARIPLVSRALAPREPRLEVRALGLTFPSPLGAAAGVDKDAAWFDGLAALGFGYVEVGTVTAVPQDGNPKPRVFRVPAARALVNSMGFPNAGAEATAARLRSRTGRTIVGANVGKSKSASLERAVDDYRTSVRQVAPHAAYLALNVSSPNTPGLREMQAVERLEALVVGVRDELRTIGVALPLLVKIAPDLSDDAIDAIADLAVRHRLDGVIAVNTTVSRDGLDSPVAERPGGVSGAPLKRRALEVLRRLAAKVDEGVVLISVGGIEGPDDAWDRILAGATLVQAYTGFVYGGPFWPRRVNRRLAARVSASGAASVQDLVGTGAHRLAGFAR